MVPLVLKKLFLRASKDKIIRKKAKQVAEKLLTNPRLLSFKVDYPKLVETIPDSQQLGMGVVTGVLKESLVSQLQLWPRISGKLYFYAKQVMPLLINQKIEGSVPADVINSNGLYLARRVEVEENNHKPRSEREELDEADWDSGTPKVSMDDRVTNFLHIARYSRHNREPFLARVCYLAC